MIWRLDIGSIRFALYVNTVIKVIGVNSYLDDGRHILMWDFDDVELEDVKRALRKVQARYFLSDIHIMETKRNSSYCAYCFTAVDWQRAIEIVAATDHVDMKYLKWSVYRGRFTLRVSPKFDRQSRKICTLEGFQLPDCGVKHLRSWTIYETVGGREHWQKLKKDMLDWLIHSKSGGKRCRQRPMKNVLSWLTRSISRLKLPKV